MGWDFNVAFWFQHAAARNAFAAAAVRVPAPVESYCGSPSAPLCATTGNSGRWAMISSSSRNSAAASSSVRSRGMAHNMGHLNTLTSLHLPLDESHCLNLSPRPPLRASPGSRNITPASTNAVSILVSIETRVSRPVSNDLIADIGTSAFVANSACDQPRRARAARICSGVTIRSA